MDIEHIAVERLKMAAELSEKYYEKPLLLAYSGGKDSEVCLELCRRAKVPFEVMYNVTTADAPETVYHVKKVFKKLEDEGINCIFRIPYKGGKPTSIWKLIAENMGPPTRRLRFCCSHLKERTINNRCAVLGVRRFESVGRSESAVAEMPGKSKAENTTFDFDNGDTRIIAPCQMKAEIKIHPIVDWTDSDIWEFIHDARLEVNPCYAMGLHRVGCIGCPMARKERYKQFAIWPKYENLYRITFDKVVQKRIETGKKLLWKNSDELFRWWMEDKNLDGQLDIFGGETGTY